MAAQVSKGSKPQTLSKEQEYKTLLDSYDTWLFDCDGVLWSGDDVIEGAKEMIEWLEAQGKQVVYVTNNASKSRKAYKGKFDKLGFPATEVRQWRAIVAYRCTHAKADIFP